MIKRTDCQEGNKKGIRSGPLGFLSSSISSSLFHNGQCKDWPCEFSDAMCSEARREGRVTVCLPKAGPHPHQERRREILPFSLFLSSLASLHTKTSQESPLEPTGGCSASPQGRRRGCMGSRRAGLGPWAGQDLLAHSQACSVSESAGPAVPSAIPTWPWPYSRDVRHLRGRLDTHRKGLIEGNVIHFHKTVCLQH